MAETTSDLVALIRAANFLDLRDELLQWRPSELATALSELRSRRSGHRLSHPAAPPRRRGLRIPAARRSAQAGQGDGTGGRGGSAEPHVAGRSHAVPQRAAGQRDEAAARPADAGRTRRSGHAARLRAGHGRPPDDAALHRRPGGLDGAAGARLRARARPGQRNAERHLRRRRRRRPD